VQQSVLGDRPPINRYWLSLVLWLALAPQFASADNVAGAWISPPDNNWPLVAIHAALTPDGRVLTYGSKGDGTQTGFFIYDVWDPSRGLAWNPSVGDFGGHITLNNMTRTDIFCSSQIVLPSSGSILIAGGDNWTGNSTTNTPNNNSNVFRPSDNTLTRQSNMNKSRWYSSVTALANGEIYIQGGNGGVEWPEIRGDDGSFRELAIDTSSLMAVFPRNFLAPDGRIFGYDINGQMYFVNTSGTGQLTLAGQLPAANVGQSSSAAMFRPGKILQFGGNSNRSVVIDVTGGSPVVRQSQLMSSVRQWVSATVLADGKVLATGGSAEDNLLNDVNTSAEIWDPDQGTNGTWHVGASGSRPRLYHSTALLLPDGSVLVAGGGAPGPYDAPPELPINLHAEIYQPPYLFDSTGALATRPLVLSAPNLIPLGQTFQIGVGSMDARRVTLVKTGSVTHSVNMDQRFLELPFTNTGGFLTVQGPASAGLAPPGYYILFVFDQRGVPSQGRMVRINAPGTDTSNPLVTITGPTSAATYATSVTPLATLSGTASDNVGVTQVTWSSDRGGSGTATGTTSWSVSGIALSSGANVLTVTARDAAGNTSTDTVTVTYTPPPPPPPPTGLVAAYAFDETTGTVTADASGNANTGTLTNGPVWAVGRNNGALQFDGVDDRVLVADANVLDLSTGATLEAWVYPTATPSGWRTILQKAADAYLLTASGDQGRPVSGGTFNGTCCTAVVAPAALAVNTWTHLATTYDGAQLRLFVNGTQVAAIAATGTYEQNANPLWIGGNALYGEHFQGRIDNLRIYNRALSATEIATDMNTPVGTAP